MMKNNFTCVRSLFLALFLGIFQPVHAQDLNMGVRDVFPRDAWVQGALLVGKPANYEITRTVLIATVPVGVQTFVVESTFEIPNGSLALIYQHGQVIDGFDIYVTGPYTVTTQKENRYQFEPGDIVQIVHPIDPNGAILQAPGSGGTVTRIIENGREVMRQEVVKDARGRRKVRWREIR